MTTKEKAKAYDEALEKARKELKQDLHESGVWAIQRIFPELRESEDERITRAINNMLPFIPDEAYTNNGVTKEDVLAWLEKQKEPTLREFIEDFPYIEQKEQKSPIEKLKDISTPADEDWFEIEKKWDAEDNEDLRSFISVKFASNAKVIDGKRFAVFTWEKFKDVAIDLINRGKEQKPIDPFDDEQFRRGYDAGKYDGYQEGYKKGMESTSYYFPVMPTPSSGFGCDGIHCTNPHGDCINCPRKYSSAGRITTVGTGSISLSTNDSSNSSGLKATNKSIEEINKETLAEPHYTKRNELFDKCVENCDPKVMKEVSDKVDEMLEKEQKPAEWSEEDENVYKWVYNLFERSNDKWFDCVFAGCYPKVRRESVLSMLKSLRPQPKIEWREEDDQLIGFIFDLLNNLIWRKDWAMSKKECLERLKSLRPQPQKLEYWTEEDERKYQCIRSILLTDADKKIGSWKYSEILEWYEKRGIGRYTNSRPSWKPSEEQMETLKRASTNEYLSAKQFDILVSLYEQLKKL